MKEVSHMLELLLVDELERIGKKDLAKSIYEGSVTEEAKKQIYQIFLKIISNQDRRTLLTADKGIIRISKRLRKSTNQDSPIYESLLNDLERLMRIKDHKFEGHYHLKNADDKYLACAIASCLRREVEEEKKLA
jgi:hypothetical protein